MNSLSPLLRVFPLILLGAGLFTFKAQAQPAEAPAKEVADVQARQVSISAVGDVIPHLPVKTSARLYGSKANFYFGSSIESLKDLIQNADISFANLETPIARKNYNKPKDFLFNADANLLRSLKWAGFDLLNIANNHSLDQSLLGLRDTIELGHKEKIPMIGSALSRKASEAGHCTTTHSLRVCSIGFTQIPVDTWKPALKKKKLWINYNYSDDQIVRAIKNLRSQSDVLIVSIHWGVEYESVASLQQKELAKKMVDAGADMILGHHPHVLQELEVVENPLTKRKALIAYSLGNFLSNQAARFTKNTHDVDDGRPRDSALLTTLFNEQGLKEFHVIPLWTFHEKTSKGRFISVRSIDSEMKKLQNRRDILVSSEKTQPKIKKEIQNLNEDIAFLEARMQIIQKTLRPENSAQPIANKETDDRSPSSK